MKRILLSVPVVVAAVVLMSGFVMAQSNPAFGTWKLDTSKSKYTPGPAPQSLTVKLEPNGKGLKSTAEYKGIAWPHAVTLGETAWEISR